MQILKHKPRWLIDINKCNFTVWKGTVSMHTSWGFGKTSTWGLTLTFFFRLLNTLGFIPNILGWKIDTITLCDVMRRSLFTVINFHFIFHARKLYILTSPNPYLGRFWEFPLNLICQLLSFTYCKKCCTWEGRGKFWQLSASKEYSSFKNENMICINSPTTRHLFSAIVPERFTFYDSAVGLTLAWNNNFQQKDRISVSCNHLIHGLCSKNAN